MNQGYKITWNIHGNKVRGKENHNIQFLKDVFQNNLTFIISFKDLLQILFCKNC